MTANPLSLAALSPRGRWALCTADTSDAALTGRFTGLTVATVNGVDYRMRYFKVGPRRILSVVDATAVLTGPRDDG